MTERRVHTVKEVFAVLLLDCLLPVCVHSPSMRHLEKLVIYQTYRCFFLAYHEEKEDLTGLSPVHSWENEETEKHIALWFKGWSLLWTLRKKGHSCFLAMTLFFKIWVKQCCLGKSYTSMSTCVFVQIHHSVMFFPLLCAIHLHKQNYHKILQLKEAYSHTDLQSKMAEAFQILNFGHKFHWNAASQ